MKIIKVVFVIEALLFIVVYSSIFYKNMWILHSDKPNKYKWFLFNPFLFFDSIFIFSWNVKVGKNKNLKRKVNKLSKVLRWLFLLFFLTLIFYFITINYEN